MALLFVPAEAICPPETLIPDIEVLELDPPDPPEAGAVVVVTGVAASKTFFRLLLQPKRLIADRQAKINFILVISKVSAEFANDLKIERSGMFQIRTTSMMGLKMKQDFRLILAL